MVGVDARTGWLIAGGHVHVGVRCCVLCGLGMYVISGCVLLWDGSMHVCI